MTVFDLTQLEPRRSMGDVTKECGAEIYTILDRVHRLKAILRARDMTCEWHMWRYGVWILQDVFPGHAQNLSQTRMSHTRELTTAPENYNALL